MNVRTDFSHKIITVYSQKQYIRHSGGLFSYFPQLFLKVTVMKMDDSNKIGILTLESFYLVGNSSEKNNLRNKVL